MQQTLTHILERAGRIRGQIEQVRRRTDVPPSRLLRLQALLLRSQRRLAELIESTAPRPVPVGTARAGSRALKAI